MKRYSRRNYDARTWNILILPDIAAIKYNIVAAENLLRVIQRSRDEMINNKVWLMIVYSAVYILICSGELSRVNKPAVCFCHDAFPS